MNRYRTYPPVFMLLLSLVVAAIIVIAFSACSTTGNGKSLAEVKETACPVILGTLAGLQVSPDIPDDVKGRLTEVEPVATAVCAAPTSTIADIKAMSEAVFAIVVDVVKGSNMQPEQKQSAIIAITTARLLIANYRPSG